MPLPPKRKYYPLTPAQRQQIRELYGLGGITRKELARRLGISYMQVRYALQQDVPVVRDGYQRQRHPPRRGVPPIVAKMFEEMQRQRCPLIELADRVGVHVNTLSAWKNKGQACRLVEIEACWNALGYELRPVLKRDDGQEWVGTYPHWGTSGYNPGANPLISKGGNETES